MGKHADMTDGLNPYRSPNVVPELSPPGVVKRFSLVRGFAYSGVFAVIGFLVPIAYFFVASTASWFLNGMPSDFAATMFFDDLDGMVLPSIGISVVFAIAAFRNFTPARQIGMVRSLKHVGVRLILSVFVVAFATIVFRLENNSYGPDPWAWLKVMIALALPLYYVGKSIWNERRLEVRSDAAE